MAETKLRLVVLWPASQQDREYMSRHLPSWYDVVFPEALDEETQVRYAREADVIFTPRLSDRVVRAAARLRLLQAPSAGINNIELATLKERGIPISNSHSHAPFVAEHAVGMLLSLMKKVAVHDRLMRQGTWFRPTGTKEDARYLSDTLIGATVGLLGFGSIAQEILDLLAGFRVSVLSHTRHPERHKDAIARHPNLRFVDLYMMLREVDALFITVPLTKATTNMIGEAELRAMKNSAYLINVARAGIVDLDALLKALKEGWIRGAGKDAWHADGHGITEFAELDNALLSPHRGGTHRYFSPHIMGAVDNLIAFARTGVPGNLVDPEDEY